MMDDGISKALNTTFESVDSPKKREIAQLEDSTQSRLKLDDKEFMRIELMDTLSSLQVVRQMIEDDLSKPPRKASDVEAYTLVISQIKECVRELRQLGADSASLELNQRKLDKQIASANGQSVGTQINNTFILDNKELQRMISDAKANSTLKQIDATFAKDEQIR